MIALSTTDGRVLRNFPAIGHFDAGFHRTFGFVSQGSVRGRKVLRARQGFGETPDSWLCRFRIVEGIPVAGGGCEIASVGQGRWALHTPVGDFEFSESSVVCELPVEKSAEPLDLASLSTRDSRNSRPALIAVAILTFAFVGLFALRAPEKVEEVSLEELERQQKTVVIPKVKVAKPKPIRKKQKKVAAKVKRPVDRGGAAIKKNLGFLALLGKKELKNAVGGMPSPAKRRSPGVGRGGDKGSGGELLAGLGKGVKQATVGNTGVVGLGGIGSAGAGGGEGGFGSSYIGSGGDGGGRVLAKIDLSEELSLEGGLDKDVIQATIAKYISQIRACYERGLRKKPGLTGQVTMDFQIAKSGRLNFAKVQRSSLRNRSVEGCISKVMLSWRFPKPVGGTLVNVSYPFMLKPASTM